MSWNIATSGTSVKDVHVEDVVSTWFVEAAGLAGAASAAESFSGVSLDREKLAGAPGFEPGTP
jgi:hypothetical protein